MVVDQSRFPLIPAPRVLRPQPGEFRLDRDIIFTVADQARNAYDLLRPELRSAHAYGSGATVIVAVDPNPERPENYSLTISADTVRIVGTDAAGALYGAQTLRQLLTASQRRSPSARSMPCAHIEDGPGLRWRGVMLDVARYFMPVSFIRRLIDLLSLHKLNVLHLHLTDDQGWRIEVPGHPRLTDLGAWRTETLVGHHRTPGQRRYDGIPHGGFYREHELREIVAYARKRAVQVVPEIDMPGHVQAALAAYPNLGSGVPTEVARHWGVSTRVLHLDDGTLGFCRDVLSHVLEIFPSRYIHCGGDEASTVEWRGSTRMQDRIRQLGVADERGLQHWFTTQMAAFLAERGRRYVGWDEILDSGPLPHDAVVMAWRDEGRGATAARAGHDVVMSPRDHVYFDQYQGDPDVEPLAYGGLTPLEHVYNFEPVPAALDRASHRVIGAQAQLWTEYIPTPSHAEYMLFPRLCAFAETVWNPDPNKRDDYSTFLAQLRVHLRALTALGVNSRPLDHHAGPGQQV